MRSIRVLGLAAVLMALSGSAKNVPVELHLKRAVSEAAIEQEFLDRAIPGAKKYLQHMSPKEVAELHRPQPGAVAAVEKFLASTDGVTKAGRFAAGDVVQVVVATGTPGAALLLDAEEDSVTTAGVPAALAPYVDYVAPGTSSQKLRGKMKPEFFFDSSSSQVTPPFPGMVQTPYTITSRYHVPTTPLNGTIVTQGVAEFNVPMAFSQSAMDEFNAHYGLPQTQVKVFGPNPQSNSALAGIEGQLDVEYIAAIAPNATTWWIGLNATATWAEFCDAVLQLDPLPDVVSISWIAPEFGFLGSGNSSTTTTPSSQAPLPSSLPTELVAAEAGFRKLALAGVSTFSGSGDDGVAAWGNERCGTRFGPNYPASSHYVTSVGGTYSMSDASPEQAVYFSGGGFSELFQRPSWQNSAVERYLNANLSGMPQSSMYNASGRGIPDVSALATNYALVGSWSGSSGWFPISGTSAATPTFAAVVTRIVAERKAKGKGSLGCITPTLYALGKVGFDVTEGASSNGCFTNSFTPQGFPAAPGWDAVTGLGTPNYEYLLSKLG